ncbi:MAG: YceI family protein [Solirubrobacteraceae bacterium]
MVKLPGRENRKRAALIAGGAGLALVVLAFLLVYFVIFPTSSPKPFKLTAAPAASSASLTSTQASTTSSGTQAGGRWSIASGSQVGYRVREKLAFLPAQSDAVGRTSQVTGGATLTESRGGLTITAASFDAAVNTLKSDRSMRDEKIHEIGLESSRYPTAAFVLSRPVALPASAGQVVHAFITGVFDVHGTSKQQTLPVEFSLSGSTLQAAGSLTFPWSEFGMSAPSVGGFVNVTGTATMEFDLRLQRA